MLSSQVSIVAILAIIGCCLLVPSSAAVMCNQSVNVYWFGSGLDDCGNWVGIYGGPHPWSGPYGAISNPTISYPPPVNAAGIEAIGTQNRFADSYIAPDYVSFKYGLHLSVSEELSFIPDGWGNLVCFGIAGATAEGNVFNVPNSNQGYDETVGAGGFNHQVALFQELLAEYPKYISPNDVFIYNSVFSDDIFGVFFDWVNDGPTEAFNAMESAGIATIQNLQNLANSGATRFVIGIVDPEALYFIPALIKSRPCDECITNFVAWLLSIMDECLYNRLEAFQQEYDVEVNVFYYSDVIGSAISNYITFSGIREPFCTDLDPRTEYCSNSCAALPFPTFMDAYMNSGVKLYNTFWFDDLHVTSNVHKLLLRQVFSNYLSALNECV